MKELESALALLPSSISGQLSPLADELLDTWRKQQVFRTETEARLSVLNDGKHPTKASKYWQAVREQGVMLGELVALSFALRRNNVQQQRISRQMVAIGNSDLLAREELGIDLEEARWQQSNMERVALDRVREIQMWSKLKEELNDDSFDTENPDTHQMKSLSEVFENRLACLGPNPAPADAFNTVALVQTARRLNGRKVERLED